MQSAETPPQQHRCAAHTGIMAECETHDNQGVDRTPQPLCLPEVHRLPDDVLAQVLAWLPTPLAVRAGATARAFWRAGSVVLRTAVWQSQRTSTSATAHHQHPWRGEPAGRQYATGTVTATPEEDEEEEEEDNELELDLVMKKQMPSSPTRRHHTETLLGTPCLDLRCVGHKADDRALLGILARAFRATGKTPPVATALRGNEKRPPTRVGAVGGGGEQGANMARGSAGAPCGLIEGELAELEGDGEGDGSRVGRGRGGSGEAGEAGRRVEQAPVLRGLAVCSSAVRDEVRR